MTHLIIAGHGKRKDGSFDPGATGYITKGEHRYVKEDLFPAIRQHLPKGHNVVLFDSYNVYSYGDIVALAKKYKAKQITEVHFDAAAASASGGHVIIYKGYGPDAMDLKLRDVIQNMVGVRYSHKGHAGISGRDNLANVNRTAKAGITYRLIELGFGTNKSDTDIMVNKVDDYAKELVKAITGSVNDKPVKPGKPSKPKDKPATSTYKGDSIVDYLNSIKVDSSFTNRKKLATANGIKNYKGTAAQNTQLLDKLKSRSKPAGKSISTMAQEVIAGKHGNGHANRRKSLGISQAEYDKVRTEVNKRFK